MRFNPVSVVKFKYLSLLPYGGRGGVTRFFMISQGIPFEEQLFSKQKDWPMEKKRLIESGDNPCGTVPVICSDSMTYPQHIAVCRYLAHELNLTSGDHYKDYVQDLVADEYHSFRGSWASATFAANEEGKANYKNAELPKILSKFDALYDRFKTEDNFLSVSAKTGQPLWGDAAMFGILRDNMVANFITPDDLEDYPRLSSMYTEYTEIPGIKEWLAKVDGTKGT